MAQRLHGDISAGYTYLDADQGGGERVSQSGWFARPSVNVSKSYSIFMDFTNYYAANTKGSLNAHGYTAGIARSFSRRLGVIPSLFVEAGDVRVSNAGKITNSPQYLTGVGLGIPLTKHWSIKLTPAEYALIDSPTGVRHDFNAKVGISFAF
jgi:hypothetical protein